MEINLLDLQQDRFFVGINERFNERLKLEIYSKYKPISKNFRSIKQKGVHINRIKRDFKKKKMHNKPFFTKVI